MCSLLISQWKKIHKHPGYMVILVTTQQPSIGRTSDLQITALSFQYSCLESISLLYCHRQICFAFAFII